jgi:hypothetical protein
MKLHMKIIFILIRRGRACMRCHADSNVAAGEQDAPIFAFAGTAYPTAHEPTDCIGKGAQGAQIVITDANGKEWLEIINAAFPKTGSASRIRTARRSAFKAASVRWMTRRASAIATHATPRTENAGAPGRILLPRAGDCLEHSWTSNVIGALLVRLETENQPFGQ